MFVIFRRPKPLFSVGQFVSVLDSDGTMEHCLLVQKREWIKQEGSFQWDWFYTGVRFKAEGSKIVLVSDNASLPEKRLRLMNWSL